MYNRERRGTIPPLWFYLLSTISSLLYLFNNVKMIKISLLCLCSRGSGKLNTLKNTLLSIYELPIFLNLKNKLYASNTMAGSSKMRLQTSKILRNRNFCTLISSSPPLEQHASKLSVSKIFYNPALRKQKKNW